MACITRAIMMRANHARVTIAKQEAIATLVRVPLVTRKTAMGVALFGEGEGGEGGGAGYAGVRVAAPGNGGC